MFFTSWCLWLILNSTANAQTALEQSAGQPLEKIPTATPQILPPPPAGAPPEQVVSPQTTEKLKTTWDIKSSLDQYTLEIVSSSAGRIDNREVSLAPLNRFLPAFNRKFVNPCPKLPKKASIEVVQTRGEERRSWRLYPEQHTFSDGKKCLAVSGKGLLEFPVHRQWFYGLTQNSVDLGDRFTLQNGSNKLTFLKRNGLWQNADEAFFTNWELIENFINTMASFEISHRTTQKPAQDAPQFTLKVKNKNYRFHKIEDTWGLELESTKWLVVSPDFKAFPGMTIEDWRSPLTYDLTALKKRDNVLGEREEVLKKLGSQWNDDIKHVFQELIMTRNEHTELLRQIVKRLRLHPTDDTMSVLARALRLHDDVDLLQNISEALRVRNPRGPRIEPGDSTETIDNKIQQWQKWANEFQPVRKK